MDAFQLSYGTPLPVLLQKLPPYPLVIRLDHQWWAGSDDPETASDTVEFFRDPSPV